MVQGGGAAWSPEAVALFPQASLGGPHSPLASCPTVRVWLQAGRLPLPPAPVATVPSARRQGQGRGGPGGQVFCARTCQEKPWRPCKGSLPS